MANGSLIESRSALSVSLFCSRKKQGCSISEAAKRKASHSSPGPKRRASLTLGAKQQLESTNNVSMKNTAVLRTSADHKPVPSSASTQTTDLDCPLYHT